MLQEIEYPINLIVIVIGTFLSSTLILFLFFNRSAKNNANLFLGGLIFVFFAFFSQAFLYRFHLLEQFPYFLGLGSPAILLLGPFAYFYFRACTQKGYRLRPIDGLHLLPFLVSFLFFIPELLKSGEERIADYLAFLNSGEFFNQGEWEVFIKSMHGIVYFIISLRFILQYRKNLSNETAAIDTTFHRWMLLLVSLLALPVTCVWFYLNADYSRLIILIQLLSFFLLLLSIYAAALFKPELFHKFPHQMLIPESSEEQKQKYESSNLQDEQKNRYIEKLQTFVDKHKPYLAPELTLAQLSEKVNIPAHYLSQIVNEKLGCTFLDFINGYRVEEAKAKLTDAKLSHYTIMAIAYESGFNSKSTFYAAFKKFAGMTPSAYRKQIKEPQF